MLLIDSLARDPFLSLLLVFFLCLFLLPFFSSSSTSFISWLPTSMSIGFISFSLPSFHSINLYEQISLLSGFWFIYAEEWEKRWTFVSIFFFLGVEWFYVRARVCVYVPVSVSSLVYIFILLVRLVISSSWSSSHKIHSHPP